MAEEEKKDFVVKDRRRFAEGGEARPQDTPEEDPTAKDQTVGPEVAADTSPPPEEEVQLPEINFATFIFSLNSSCLVHLGIIEDPATGQKTRNLPMAKQTIDILGMMEEKTQGNLTSDEANMLKNILYDLRIIYVKEKG
jgi:hypothetical protein